MGTGGSFRSWVRVVIRGCWASIVGAGSLSMGSGSLFVGVGLSITGGGVRSHGGVVRACWFVVRGRGGDVSCAGVVIVSKIGWNDGVLTMNDSMNTTMNDNIVIICRLVATSPSTTWHLHLQLPPSFSFRCDVALLMLAVVVDVGDGCEWRPLLMGRVVMVKQGWR